MLYLCASRDYLATSLVARERLRIDTDANSLPVAPELMTRYQSALDNDLYKAMRALREAQRFRRETIDIAATLVEG